MSEKPKAGAAKRTTAKKARVQPVKQWANKRRAHGVDEKDLAFGRVLARIVHSKSAR